MAYDITCFFIWLGQMEDDPGDVNDVILWQGYTWMLIMWPGLFMMNRKYNSHM